MSDFWRDAKEGSKQIGEVLGYDAVVGPSESTKQKRRAAMEAAKPRKPPTLDDAARTQIETDRLRNRKGVLANIYGGASPSRPRVATKELLGA